MVAVVERRVVVAVKTHVVAAVTAAAAAAAAVNAAAIYAPSARLCAWAETFLQSASRSRRFGGIGADVLKQRGLAVRTRWRLNTLPRGVTRGDPPAAAWEACFEKRCRSEAAADFGSEIVINYAD